MPLEQIDYDKISGGSLINALVNESFSSDSNDALYNSDLNQHVNASEIMQDLRQRKKPFIYLHRLLKKMRLKRHLVFLAKLKLMFNLVTNQLNITVNSDILIRK